MVTQGFQHPASGRLQMTMEDPVQDFSPWRLLAAIVAGLSLSAPVAAQSTRHISDFLDTIGGSTSAKTVDGHLQGRAQMMLPLTRDASQVIGARYFSEKLTANGLATAERARGAFADECRAKGGALADERSEVHTLFRDRVLRGVTWQGIGGKYFQTGMVAVCGTNAGDVLGGYVAVIYDTTAVNKGLVTALIGKVPTDTAIYAYRPDRIVSQAMIDRRLAGRVAAEQADLVRETERQAGFERFRKAIELGTYTNCGTVIQLRGPLVEVALPPTQTAPNGQATFWSRRDALFPPGSVVCTYGL